MIRERTVAAILRPEKKNAGVSQRRRAAKMQFENGRLLGKICHTLHEK